MSTTNSNTLIVGQGMAGTLMARRLERAGLSFQIIDRGHGHSSTAVAAGIINPVTGRHMVKSWRFDDLLPELIAAYRDFEALLGIPILNPTRVLRVLPSVSEENKWHLQAGKEGYAPYLRSFPDAREVAPHLKPVHAFGEIQNAFTVNWPDLLSAYRAHLEKAGKLINETFDHGRLVRTPKNLTYGPHSYGSIIFCEGAGVRTNPFFSNLPLEGAKGEVLLIRIPGASFRCIIKHRLLIAPWQDDIYWAGSNYERGATDPRPTEKTRARLLDSLREILLEEPEITGHLAGIRPTVSDRRPLIGRHPDDPRVVLFNGLGTKGSSLAPFWSAHLFDHLFSGTPIDPEVDCRRFL